LINDSTYFKHINNRDEENKVQNNYYDIFGNITLNVKGRGLSTAFTYNGLNQLIPVTSPESKVTTYEYDTLRYKYHVETGELVFNNYDDLNRLLSTGVTNYNLDIFDTLKAGIIHSGLDDNMAKYVLVNVYDDFNNRGGAFSGMTFPQNFVQGNLTGKLAAEAFRDKPLKNWNYKLYSYDPLG